MIHRGQSPSLVKFYFFTADVLQTARIVLIFADFQKALAFMKNFSNGVRGFNLALVQRKSV